MNLMSRLHFLWRKPRVLTQTPAWTKTDVSKAIKPTPPDLSHTTYSEEEMQVEKPFVWTCVIGHSAACVQFSKDLDRRNIPDGCEPREALDVLRRDPEEDAPQRAGVGPEGRVSHVSRGSPGRLRRY